MKVERVLVVDDETEMVATCRDILERAGYEVEVAGRGEEALALLRGAAFDLALVDLRMPGMNGLDLVAASREIDPGLTVVVITAFPEIATAVEAVKRGAFDYLAKPFSSDQLLLTARRAFANRGLVEENRVLRGRLDAGAGELGFLGGSPPVARVLDLVRKVAPTDSNVLLVGESGTGKELLARGLHRLSSRRVANFVPLNCAALPETLLESELFGYERGAFTGAYRSMKGLLDLADGGTFFLDEVCELPLNLQAKLLRVIESQQFLRVGGRETQKVDVRIVAATNRDIHEAVRRREFREDLFYRLNVILLEVPPLRDREGDVPLLAEHFLAELNRHNPGRTRTFAPETLRVLEAHLWPGNVRELANAIERAFAVSDGDLLEPGSLPAYLADRPAGAAPEEGIPYQEARRRSLQSFERAYLEHLLRECRGNVSGASRRAGLHRSALQRLLRRHGLRSEDFRPPERP